MATNLKYLSTEVISSRTTPSELLELLLKNRGVMPSDQAEFLSVTPPKLDLNLKPALDLIEKTIKANKNILIYGDYDVDGITATAILWQVIHQKYAHVTPFIPHRENDGYGVKADSFFRFQQEKGINFDLLITVDNGIVAQPEITKIKAKQDIKVIITDHHLADNLPQSADVVVHSTEVSGAAISYFLAREISPTADLGLAALGTVADCLPLTGVNRSLVVHGLKELRLNPSPGIKKLIQISGAKVDSLTTFDLGYSLGPRINAVGRLSDPTEALRLLCSSNLLQADKYAQSLNSFNQNRQGLQKESIEIAESKVKVTPDSKLIYVADESFNPGIIGLIAGRLTEKYYLPSVIMAINDGTAKGSCRSIPELNIIDALRVHRDLFIDLGGHAGAAGFTIATDNIPQLESLLTQTISHKLAGLVLKPSLTVDASMELSAVNMPNIEAIDKLNPFGIGNPEPYFVFKGLKIVSLRTMGQQNEHLRLKLDDPRTPKVEYLAADAVAFKKGSYAAKMKPGDLIDLVAKLDANTWNGHTTPQLLVKEIIFEEV